MSTKNRRSSRWFCAAFKLSFFLGWSGALHAQQLAQSSIETPTRPDLVGHVQATSGEFLTHATVFIYTAGPKTGTSTFCPSCYADCRKHARTDNKGAFRIESLDPQLLFRVLAVAKGYKPAFASKVDPAHEPLTIKLEPVDSGEVATDRSVKGQILDPAGNPVFGAVVEAHGIRKKNDVGTMWGTLPGVDPLAVTDEHGEFLLTARDAFESLDLRVEARGFANRIFTRVASGGKTNALTLTEGATLTGRVLNHGKPLAGVQVGLVSVDRSAESFTGNFEIGTGADGRFTFVNLPPNVDYFVYGLMDTLRPYGSISGRQVQARGDGSTLDVGDLPVEPGQRLAGQVVLADGARLPANTRLLVSRESAWDSLQLPLDEKGHFQIAGIPREALTLSVRVPGYRISTRNRSLDTLNPFRLVGRVEHDVTNFVFLLEKGAEQRTDYGLILPESAWPQNRPLQGAEGTDEHSGQFLLAGQVRDSRNGKLVSAFEVTPGNANPAGRPSSWDDRNRATGTNGHFVVYLDQRFAQPDLKIEAAGYLPNRFTVLPESRTNLDFTLEAGAGPGGTVLLPNGQPAAEASLALLCTGDDSIRLNAEGRLRSFRDKNRIQITDPDGSFSFAPELDMQSIVVASEAGFKLADIRELKNHSNLVLEPWGSITGTLHRGSAPGTNETLDVALQGAPPLFLETHTQTDAKGRFAFGRVPPGKLEVTARDWLDEHGWRNEFLQRATLKPGEELALTINATVRRSASPVFPGGMNKPLAQSARLTGPGPQGTVLLANGHPAVDAEVALLVKGKFLSVGRGGLRAFQARQQGLVTHCDASGHFSLPAESGATGVVVANEKGYAQVNLLELKKTPKITLQPWGRIEGVLYVGRYPGTNQLLTLEQTDFADGGPMFDSNDFQARTDETGRFIMTFVPPGERKIARMLPMGAGSWVHAPAALVQVEPGEVTRVTIGGSGRTVIGKVRLNQPEAQIDWEHSHAVLRTPFPGSHSSVTKTAADGAWMQSPEGKAFRKNARFYPVQMKPDGSFRAEDVDPGEYELSITFMSPGQRFPMAEGLGTFQKLVSIPKNRDEKEDPPVDLGALEGNLEKLPAQAAGR